MDALATYVEPDMSNMKMASWVCARVNATMIGHDISRVGHVISGTMVWFAQWTARKRQRKRKVKEATRGRLKEVFVEMLKQNAVGCEI